MGKFDEVAKDVLTAIDKLEYTDAEKKLLLTNIMYNLYNLLENQQKYNTDVKVLQKYYYDEQNKGLKM